MDMTYRATCRGQLTKIVKAAMEYVEMSRALTDSETVQEELEVHLAKVKACHAALKEADKAVRPLIKEDNHTAECNSIVEYDEKATAVIARLEYRLNVVRRPATALQAPNIQEQASANSSSNHTITDNTSSSSASVLTGKAAATIAGLTPSEACYNEAIEMLKEEYHYHRKNLEPQSTTAVQSETTVLETTAGSIECDSQIKNLLNFIKCEAESLERADIINERKQTNERNIPTTRTATGLFTLSQSPNNCFFWFSKQHITKDCDFNQITIQQRKDKLKESGRCFRCTLPKHSSKNCKNKFIRCKKCSGRHATSMCDPEYPSKKTDVQKQMINSKFNADTSQSKQTNAVSLLSSNHESVFLQTACAFAFSNQEKNKAFVRLVFDSASQRSYIREKLSKRLNLPVVGVEAVNIIPFGSETMTPQTICNQVRLVLKGPFSDECLSIIALEVPEICLDILPIPRDVHPELQELQLADSRIPTNSPIDGISILIGADFYWRFVTGETKLLTERLAAVNTKLGWTLHGPAIDCKQEISTQVTSLMVNSFAFTEFNLTQFWSLEALGITNDISVYNKEFLEEFLEQSVQWRDNRYEVSLPWKNDDYIIDNNYFGAMTRLNALTQKLRRNEDKLLEYDKVVWEMIHSGVAELARDNSTNRKVFYLPHRPIYRDDKQTTKIRMVFDASAHAPGRKSLNEYLHQGPNLLPDLLTILLGFRIGKIAIVADIEKAFLQISIRQDQRDAQRFLWYEKPLMSGKALLRIKMYRLARVTFGVNSSPFLLNAVITKHLQKSRSSFERTCDMLAANLYVDDLVSSVDTVDSAITLYNEAKMVMSSAAMNLRKWNSNNEQIKQLCHERGDNSNTCPTQKVLGTMWCTLTDEIQVDLSSVQKFVESDFRGTKRSVLQSISRIYDPLGLLSPYIIKIKILMQSIWKLRLPWDDILPTDLLSLWQAWCLELTNLKSLYFPLCIFHSISTEDNDDVQLHLFSDASPKAYGVAAYVRRQSNTGNISVNLLCAKNRVAPLNQNNDNELSLPKLELMAALISSRLRVFLEKNLSLQFNATFFWTDSSITLSSINGYTNRWKPFIANRVREINLPSKGCHWKYCPGSSNPADLLTRGVNAKTLLSSQVWGTGPTWLSQSQEMWPSQSRKDISLLNSSQSQSPTIGLGKYDNPIMQIETMSSFLRLIRITAYVFRLIYYVLHPKQERKLEHLSAEELEVATLYWIAVEQKRYYGEEIESLNKRQAIDRHSRILTLDPCIDEKGILRLGGRLQQINDETNIAHPIILPKASHLSLLLSRQAHQETNPGGTNVVLAYLKKKYWIVRGRQLIKNVLSKCVVCKRLMGKSANEPFAPIPKDRLLGSRAFNITGVDFAGPLFVKSFNEGALTKIYIMLFTCAAIRAVHLELVHDLTTESCLHAIRRFIARRGVPTIIYSDNAKTFKRADYELQTLYKQVNTESITSFSANHCIRWKYIVERAPWWGGWWERLIRTIKNALKATIGRGVLNHDQLQTIITEVEAVLNSRPLTYITDDPKDLQPLTPANFLLCPTQVSLPNVGTKHSTTKGDLNDIWRERHKYINLFWKRWTSEYVHQLRSAHHTKTPSSSHIQEADVVLIYEQKIPRLLWKLARVAEIFTGRDGNSTRMRSCACKRQKASTTYPNAISLGGSITELSSRWGGCRKC